MSEPARPEPDDGYITDVSAASRVGDADPFALRPDRAVDDGAESDGDGELGPVHGVVVGAPPLLAELRGRRLPPNRWAVATAVCAVLTIAATVAGSEPIALGFATVTCACLLTAGATVRRRGTRWLSAAACLSVAAAALLLALIVEHAHDALDDAAVTFVAREFTGTVAQSVPDSEAWTAAAFAAHRDDLGDDVDVFTGAGFDVAVLDASETDFAAAGHRLEVRAREGHGSGTACIDVSTPPPAADVTAGPCPPAS